MANTATKKSNGKSGGNELVSVANIGYTREQILNILLQETEDETIRTTVEFSKEATKIIIPDGMSKKEAAKDLMNQWENEEQTQAFNTTLEGWEWKDALRAFRNVMEDKFGWIKGKETWYSTPTEIDIIVDYRDGVAMTEKAFHGQVNFPVWENCQGGVSVNKTGEVTISVTAKRKFSQQITQFFREIRQYLANNSIYRGKACIVTKNPMNEGVDLQLTELKKNPKIFLNEKEQTVVDNFIMAQLDDTGKRTFLFTGDYGNGKTEEAITIGVEAVRKGITFFYVKDSSMFDKVLAFARNYEPALIFLEDVDEITSGNDRDARMNQILNTLDGVQTKGRNITTIFTTNHENRINTALRRPGRIDLIVKFENPNKEAIEKIFRSYFEPITGAEELDYEHIKAHAPDVQGAVIAEIAKRAVKLAQKRGYIATDMVVASIASMDYQIKFMRDDLEAADKVREAFETTRAYMNGNLEFGTPAGQN